jgi:predicted esterase
VTPAQTDALADLLRRAGAAVTLARVPGGHGLTREDVAIGRQWLGRITQISSR